MEQHSQAQTPVRLHPGEGVQRMLSHRVPVVGMVLHGLTGRIKLREKDPGEPQFIGIPQIVGVGGGQYLGKLCADSLCADMSQIGRDLTDGVSGLLLDFVSQLGGESHRPQDPEGILGKAFQGLTHTADNAGVYVLDSSVQIHQSLGIVISHGIDGKIPASQILLQIRGENHLFGMSAVLVLSVNAVGGNLEPLPVHHHRHRAVLQPGIHCSGEKCLDTIRGG